MSFLIISFRYFALRSVRHRRMDSKERLHVTGFIVSEEDILFAMSHPIRLLIIIPFAQIFAFRRPAATPRHAGNAYASMINYFSGHVIFPSFASSTSPHRNGKNKWHGKICSISIYGLGLKARIRASSTQTWGGLWRMSLETGITLWLIDRHYPIRVTKLACRGVLMLPQLQWTRLDGYVRAIVRI